MNLPIRRSMTEERFADDPVIPKGSPLQEYLNSLCLNDEGYVSDYFRKKQENYEIKSKDWFKDSVKKFMSNKWSFVRNSLSSVFPISQNILRELCQNFYYRYGEEIVSSKIIVDEDLDFLCLQTPQIFVDIVRKGDKSHYQQQQRADDFEEDQMADSNLSGDTEQKRLESSRKHFILYSSVAVVCVSLLYNFMLSPYFHALLGILVAIYVVFNIRLKIVQQIWKRKLNSNMTLLRSFLQSSYKFLLVSRQSIRMTQELEVVTLGYRLVNGATPASRLEQAAQHRSKRRSCERLRALLIRTTKQCVVACRASTLQLIQHHLPQASHHRRSDRANVCEQLLESLHPSLIAGDENEMELFEASDGYSLQSLKLLNGLLRRQISELVTYLFISLSTCTWDFTKDGLFLNLHEVLWPSLQAISASHKSVKCSYEMYKYVNSKGDDKTASCLTAHPRDETRRNDNMTSAFTIHLKSLQAHMRNAALMSIEMEERLNKMSSEGQQQVNSETYATGLLENIEHHIGVSGDCLMKCYEELKLVKNKQDQCESPLPPLRVEERRREEDDDEADVIKVGEKDQAEFHRDQVFEAVVEGDDEEDGGETRRTNDDDDDEEEALRGAEQLRVMSELRSVLAHHTSVDAREERKMKLFPTYTPSPPHNTIRNMFSFYNDDSSSSAAAAPSSGYSKEGFARPSMKGVGRRACDRKAMSARLRRHQQLRDEEEEKEEVTVPHEEPSGIGFGFSPMMAAQAAAMAKSRGAMVGGACEVLGSSDEDVE